MGLIEGFRVNILEVIGKDNLYTFGQYFYPLDLADDPITFAELKRQLRDSRMVHSEPWLDSLSDDIGFLFCFGISSGSAFYMLKGMYNSPKGERLIRGSQALRMNAPRFASNCAIWGGLYSVFESSMTYVRQKDDPWNNILSAAAASGFLKMRQGLGPASRSALFFGAAVALLEGWEIMDNKATSNVQSQLDKK
ncbi:unnamed protein product [Fraxinus pennsylvanica]|uniref:Uncharacterized protein n=1 Tax=Fraxinus pennsylvanica TaxID=56036 RepID=A0AAD1ZSI1_9LAMI|nr:unnamed protein product [Fraxinus pennsylvanica]